MQESKQLIKFNKSFQFWGNKYLENYLSSKEKLFNWTILLNGSGLIAVMAFIGATFLNSSFHKPPFRYSVICFTVGLMVSFISLICEHRFNKFLLNKFVQNANKLPKNSVDPNFFQNIFPLEKEAWPQKFAIFFFICGIVAFISGVGCGTRDFLSLAKFTNAKTMSAEIECPTECSFLTNSTKAKKEEKPAVNSKKTH